MLELISTAIKTINFKLRSFQYQKRSVNLTVNLVSENLINIKQIAQDKITMIYDKVEEAIQQISESERYDVINFEQMFKDQMSKTNFKSQLMGEINILGHIYSFLKNQFSKTNNEINAQMEI